MVRVRQGIRIVRAKNKKAKYKAVRVKYVYRRKTKNRY